MLRMSDLKVLAFLGGVALLAGCADAPPPAPRVATAAFEAGNSMDMDEAVVGEDGGFALTGAEGELADARAVLDAYAADAVARRRPDLMAVADAAFGCWEDALAGEEARAEAAACRYDFWSAVNALRAAQMRQPAVAGR